MSMIRVKGFKIFRDKKPPFKERCYHRATGHKIDLDKAPIGSAAFFAECERIRALAEAVKAKEPKVGTLGGLIATYYRTEHFSDTLSDRTRKDYRKVADYLGPILDTPAHRLDTPPITAIHDKATIKLGWRQANMLRTFLFEVFRYCIPKGLIASNPATAVIPKPRPKSQRRANRPWTVDELDVVLSLAPPQIRVAVALMANTGLDPSDALNLRRDKIKDGVIWANRGKTGREVALPITGRLRAALDAAPPHDALTVLASTKGKPWTYDGLATVWHRWRAKQVGAGTIPADLLGQSEEAMAAWYSRDADLAERNRIAADLLDSEIERRTKVVKPFPKTVKSEERSEA